MTTSRNGMPPVALAQAAAMQAQGRLWEAEKLYEAILAETPRQFDAAYRFGILRLQQRRFDEAEALFRRAVRIDKKSADARHHLAIALTGTGRIEEAVEQYREALEQQPKSAELHNNLGYALNLLGLHEEAARSCQKALAINPRYPEAHNNLGNALQGLMRHDEATAHYREALVLRPNDPEALTNLSGTLSARNRYEEAIELCRQALAAVPHYAPAHINLGNALAALGRADAAIAQYEKLLALDPGQAHARMLLGHTLFHSNRPAAALAQFEQLVAADAGNADAINNAGVALRALGRNDEAIAAFDKAIALSPRNGAAYHNLANSRRFTTQDPHFSAMKKLARNAGALPVESQIGLQFALGKIFAEIGDHKQAFRHFAAGNSLKRQQIHYDEEKALNQFEAIETVFTADLIRSRKSQGHPDPLPIFIIGMPRSGTTLVEQILASHPKVFGAGELHDFGLLTDGIKGSDGRGFPEAGPAMRGEELHALGAAYVEGLRRRAPDAERITDKMPANFRYAGLIHLALPQAKIIHVRRDLRDVALSCFSIMFSGGQYFTYDLAELGRYLRAYRSLMAHWRAVLPPGAMLEIDYEAMVDDLPGSARRIVDYCGLEWDDALLTFHETKRSVQTASVMQVRQPIYRSSVGRWRDHEKELAPLFDILAAP